MSKMLSRISLKLKLNFLEFLKATQEKESHLWENIFVTNITSK